MKSRMIINVLKSQSVNRIHKLYEDILMKVKIICVSVFGVRLGSKIQKHGQLRSNSSCKSVLQVATKILNPLTQKRPRLNPHTIKSHF